MTNSESLLTQNQNDISFKYFHKVSFQRYFNIISLKMSEKIILSQFNENIHIRYFIHF